MLTTSTATATALTIHHTALLFMKTSKFVNNRLATRNFPDRIEGSHLYGPRGTGSSSRWNASAESLRQRAQSNGNARNCRRAVKCRLLQLPPGRLTIG